MTRRAFDVAVLGGGPAGASAAATAARSGASVVLYERRSHRAFRVGEGVPPETPSIIRDAFGDDVCAFEPSDHRPSFGTLSAWATDELVAKDAVFHPLGHGWHLDRVRFDERLRAAAIALGVHHEHVDVTGREEREAMWRARIVVDATGRRALYARAQGARRSVIDGLLAVVAVFGDVDDPDGMTTIEATATGWWYTAALPHRRRVVVYLTDPDLLPEGVRAPAGFVRLLERTRHVVAALRGTDRPMLRAPKVVAADTALLEPIGGVDWLAAGDASSSFDPLSSQGIVAALSSGRHAGEAAAAIASGADSHAVLTTATSTRDRVMREYLTRRADHYGDVRRFAGEEFWSRRSRAAEAVVSARAG